MNHHVSKTVTIITILFLLISLGLPSYSNASKIESNSGTPQDAMISETDTEIVIKSNQYQIQIIKNGFKYSFKKSDGTVIADHHADSGIRFSGAGGATLFEAETTELINFDDEKVHLLVTNTNGDEADVYIYPNEHHAQYQIIPKGTGEVEFNQENVLVQTSTNAEGFIWVGDTTWTDYTTEAEINLSGHDNSASGLVFRYINANNYYHFRLNEGQGDIQLLKKKDGAFTVVKSIPRATEGNKWYTLKVTAEGNDITTFVDGEELFTYTDNDAPFLNGAVGMRTWRDNTKIRSLVISQDGNLLYQDRLSEKKMDEWNPTLGTWSITSTGQTPSTGRIIDARTAPLGPAYGLGDYGRNGSSTNVFGFSNSDITNKGGQERFISNFTVFPSHDFAQVLFENGQKRVTINSTENKLGTANVEKVEKLYYFFGDMKEIYKEYQEIRFKEGYPEYKPKYDFFEVGYEAFGSLGWNTYQTSVMNDLQTYLDKGYQLKWGVVGSGFWKGDRSKPDEGATTSFGIWDDEYEEGRVDDLPNPRYPDVQGMKNFFTENDMKFFLGLRTNFKATTENGGNHKQEHDGPFTYEGIDNNYFLEDEEGDPLTYKVNFPKGNVHLLNGDNPAALDWYVNGVNLWGVNGFKEDTMLQSRVYHDGLWNKSNEKLMENGYYVMVRNAAYSVPGDIMRYEDTQHGISQDRPIINALNYAASGAPNVYSDIVAGKYINYPLTADQKKYFVRNAMYAALTPAMSMGLGPWVMENEEYEADVKKAVDFHSMYAPYIYSAAVDSFNTGFPYTMTPMPLAFPEDEHTYELANKTTRQYQWMLGPSMLAVPAYGDDYASVTSRDVYLPEGKWIDFETGDVFYGPQTLEDFALPTDKIPVFIGGKGVIVNQDLENENLFAEVFPIATNGSSYTYTAKDGETTSTIINNNSGWNSQTLTITDLTSGEAIPFNYDVKKGSFSFELTPGHDYELTGGEYVGELAHVELSSADELEILTGETVQLNVRALLDTGEEADLSKATIIFKSENETIATVDEQGLVTGQGTGTAQLEVDVTLDGKTVKSNFVEIVIIEPSISFTELDDGEIIRFLPFTIRGTSNGANQVTLQLNEQQPIAVNVADGKWSYSINDLATGKYIVEAVIKDTHGNVRATETVQIFVLVGDILLADDFNEFDTNTWKRHSGNWSTGLVDSENSLIGSASTEARIYGGSKDWEDYTLSTKFQFTGNGGGSAGVLFRYTDDRNFYHFRIDHNIQGGMNKQTAQLYKWVNGTATLIAEQPFLSSNDTWYDVQVGVQGDHIQAYINGELLIDTTDNSLTKGAVGYRSYYKPIRIDEINVREWGMPILETVSLAAEATKLGIGETTSLQVVGTLIDNSPADLTKANKTYQTNHPELLTFDDHGNVTVATNVKDIREIEVWVDIQLDGKIVTSNHITLEIESSIQLIAQTLDYYEAEGVIEHPLSKQLENALRQAQHHKDAGRTTQAIKHLQDFKKHLNNKAMNNRISIEAKDLINRDVDAVIENMSS